VWPLCGSGGDGGSRVPHAFGWEVPVSVPRLVSRSDAEAGGQGARDVSEAGVWLRYDLILVKLFRMVRVNLFFIW
jgi:hypothetical protein